MLEDKGLRIPVVQLTLRKLVDAIKFMLDPEVMNYNVNKSFFCGMMERMSGAQTFPSDYCKIKS